MLLWILMFVGCAVGVVMGWLWTAGAFATENYKWAIPGVLLVIACFVGEIYAAVNGILLLIKIIKHI